MTFEEEQRGKQPVMTKPETPDSRKTVGPTMTTLFSSPLNKILSQYVTTGTLEHVWQKEGRERKPQRDGGAFVFFTDPFS